MDYRASRYKWFDSNFRDYMKRTKSNKGRIYDMYFTTKNLMKKPLKVLCILIFCILFRYIFFGKEKSWEIVVSSGEAGENIFAQKYMFPPPV